MKRETKPTCAWRPILRSRCIEPSAGIGKTMLVKTLGEMRHQELVDMLGSESCNPCANRLLATVGGGRDNVASGGDATIAGFLALIANPISAVREFGILSSIGVVIITDAIAEDIRPQVDEVRLERERPLVVEIPGPGGPISGRKTLRQLVQEAVGIRISQEEESE